MRQLLLSRPVIGFVYFVERWVLSIIFLFLAFEYVDTLRFMRLVTSARAFITPAVIARDAGFLDGVHFEDYARYTLLALSNALCGILLLISRRPRRHPSRASEVLIPLLATFSYMLFNQRIPFPLWVTTPFVPPQLATPLATIGVALSFSGAVFAALAMAWLGRSLGIVVSVREIVLAGPYRYVRHPIYGGYFLGLLGLSLTACNFRMTVLTMGTLALLIWRARLEERLLCDFSPAYREWMQKTGFLWPRFGSRSRRGSLFSPAASWILPHGADGSGAAAIDAVGRSEGSACF